MIRLKSNIQNAFYFSPGKTKCKYVLRYIERSIRNLEYEKCYVISTTGRVIQKRSGGNTRINTNGLQLKNNILTHNHPQSKNGGTGGTLSGNDIITFAEKELSEIRAVDSTNLYSFKKPSDGWNETNKKKLFNSAYKLNEENFIYSFINASFKTTSEIENQILTNADKTWKKLSDIIKAVYLVRKH